jgi:N utilization substance protein B
MEFESRKPRQKARELALITLYLYQLNSDDLSSYLDFKWFEDLASLKEDDLLYVNSEEKENVYSFAKEILIGTISNIKIIDEVIKKHLVNWKFERLRELDKALLRISIYSIIYRYDIPSEVIISEANRLATLYCEENTPYYVNGILHRVKEEFRGKIKKFTEDVKDGRTE